MPRVNLILYLPIIIINVCCSAKKPKSEDDNVLHPVTNQVRHANNFSIKILEDGTKLAEVIEPYKGATKSLKYWLVPKEMDIPPMEEDRIVIRTPINSIVCTSTTHITPLELLGVSDKLIGFPSTQYISSEIVRDQVQKGHTIELGKDSNLNTEILIDLEPELIMSYTLTGDISQLEPIERVGIPIIQIAEYLEETPLGRAEWLKFVGFLFNKEELADSIFKVIESNYLRVKLAASEVANRPSVLSGIVYGDTWYVPAGNSWAGKFFKDAGANFLWKDTESSGSLQLSFEAVYEKAYKANVWIGAADYYSLEELRNTDDRYAQFEAFQSGRVYTYNARAIKNGGNDYFESGFSRPDIVLSDLVNILHPGILDDDELFYYRKLDN